VQFVLGLTCRGGAPPRLATGHLPDEYRVDPDAVSAEILGRGLGDGQAGRAGGGRRQRRGASGLGAYAEHVDDGSAARGGQVRHSQAGAADRGKNLQVKVGDPVVVGDLIDPSRGAPARVVHQAVDAAPPGDGGIDEPLEVSQPGDIGLHRNRITPGIPQ
jgi:hypothetical protein